MKVLIIGLGSIGKRHARLIHELDERIEIYALRSGYGRGELPGVKNIVRLSDIDKVNPDCAFICTPTHMHLDYAIECAWRKIPIFLEKPIAEKDSTKLEYLLMLLQADCLTCYVAYPFRHNSIISELKGKLSRVIEYDATIYCKTYMPNWGKNFSFRSETGGGALLELSHEIDIAVYLFGEIDTITGKAKRYTDITMDCEDFADIKILHRNGCGSSIVLDIASGNEGRAITVESKTEEIFSGGYRADDIMYAKQIVYFLKNMNNPRIDNNLEQATKTFRKIMGFKNDQAINNNFSACW